MLSMVGRYNTLIECSDLNQVFKYSIQTFIEIAIETVKPSLSVPFLALSNKVLRMGGLMHCRINEAAPKSQAASNFASISSLHNVIYYLAIIFGS